MTIEDELLDLWRVARVAGAVTRHERLLYAAKEYHKAHPDESYLRAYKTIDRLTQGY
jgi:hypothetical protein